MTITWFPYLQLEGERNYHIFYRMLAGMNRAELTKLKLVKDAEAYAYLTKVTYTHTLPSSPHTHSHTSQCV